MSDVSEFLSEALSGVILGEAADLAKAAKPEDIVSHVQMGDAKLKTIPGFLEHNPYSEWLVARALRRVVRHHGGRDWPEVQESLDLTKNDCLKELMGVAYITLADGILMGREPIPVIKKFTTLQDLGHVWLSDAFRTEADLVALSMSADIDVDRGLRKYIMNCVYVTGASAGARAHGGPLVTGDQIFDIWGLGSEAAMLGIYAAGVKLGQKQEQDAVLEGIMSASTTEDTTEQENKQ